VMVVMEVAVVVMVAMAVAPNVLQTSPVLQDLGASDWAVVVAVAVVMVMAVVWP